MVLLKIKNWKYVGVLLCPLVFCVRIIRNAYLHLIHKYLNSFRRAYHEYTEPTLIILNIILSIIFIILTFH